jgi:hypothetical protein
MRKLSKKILLSLLLISWAATAGGGCDLFDSMFESDLAVWNQMTETTPDGIVTLGAGGCVPIMESRSTTMEGDTSGPGFADYFISTNGELFHAYYIAPEGEPAWSHVTPQNGELVADFTFRTDSFDDRETIGAVIEKHDGTLLEIVHWAAPSCDEDSEPPTESDE